MSTQKQLWRWWLNCHLSYFARRVKMPVNFRKAKGSEAKCSSCGADYSESITMYEYRIGKQNGVLCDLCLKELFNKTLKVTCLVDKERKDQRQIKVMNLRGQKLHPKDPNKMSINEALRGIEDNDDLVE